MIEIETAGLQTISRGELHLRIDILNNSLAGARTRPYARVTLRVPPVSVVVKGPATTLYQGLLLPLISPDSESSSLAVTLTKKGNYNV